MNAINNHMRHMLKCGYSFGGGGCMRKGTKDCWVIPREHAKLGTIKDRSAKDLIEAEEI